MNVKIDIDIIQNILKTYARRDRNQCRIYGILLGNMEGKNSYHVKNCIFGYIYETKDESQKSGPVYINSYKIIFDYLFNKDFYNTSFSFYFYSFTIYIPNAIPG